MNKNNKMHRRFKKKFEDKEGLFDSLNDTQLIEDIEQIVAEDESAAELLSAIVEFFDQGGIISEPETVWELFANEDTAKALKNMKEVLERLKKPTGVDLAMAYAAASEGWGVFFDLPIEVQTGLTELLQTTNTFGGSELNLSTSIHYFNNFLDSFGLNDSEWRTSINNGRFSRFIDYMKKQSNPSKLGKEGKEIMKDYLIGALE